jgi:hypothetical protein
MNSNHILGFLCIVVGVVIIIWALGDLLIRFLIALAAFSLINYGLRLRGLPPLPILIQLVASRNRWF